MLSSVTSFKRLSYRGYHRFPLYVVNLLGRQARADAERIVVDDPG